MNAKASNARRIISVGVLLFFFVFFVFDLVKIQLVDGAKYDAAISPVREDVVPIKAARGEIVDCDGIPLVYNDQGYSIIVDAAYFPPASEREQRNKIILSLIKLFEAASIKWRDPLPLVFDEKGKIVFAPDSEKLVAEMKSPSMLNLNEYADAQNCFDALVERFSLESYPPSDARKAASVQYEMLRESFRIENPYVFATDVPDEIVSKIKENGGFYKGVDVRVVPVRKHADGFLAPHVLGRVGAIDADEYRLKKDKGYKITDLVGKSGIELAMEDYLRGTDGAATVFTGSNGERSTETTSPPVQGNSVVLTIRSGLQRVARDALKKALLDYSGSKRGNMVEDAGAAVVIDCRDGSILACVSYPTYDVSAYAENAEKLDKAPGSPLWNRALLSTYATGSTMKPSVAIAALEEGVINKNTTVRCNGTYYYMGQKFKCEQNHANRNVNVVAAIDESCNVFFYEVGRLLGVEKMNEYRTLLGLGAKTGCEIGEAAGVLDSPEYRASINQKWLPGYTIQSAIGQAGNLFTPVQLANYCAAIANGGVRYKTHFVKSIKSYNYDQTVFENKPVIAAKTGISSETMAIVKEGMLRVGVSGYCAKYFRGLPVKVSAKTGTSQEIRKLGGVPVKINNGFLIAFAPSEAPEIAIAAVGEGMVSGVFVAPVVAEIVRRYFARGEGPEKIQPENVLIP